MTTQFTPGPWAVTRPHGDLIYVEARHGGRVYTHIATFEKEANAALVAAAPELYEIVAGELANLEFNSLGNGSRAIEMRKVLAKARGE